MRRCSRVVFANKRQHIFHMEAKTPLIIALSLEQCLCKSACAIANIHCTKTHLYVPHGRKKCYAYVYIEIATNKKRAEWMKGICHMWSRGRHFSPSLPGDRYLNLGSKSDHRAEISGNIVWYDALAPSPEVVRSFSCIYANSVLSFVYKRNFPETDSIKESPLIWAFLNPHLTSAFLDHLSYYI